MKKTHLSIGALAAALAGGGLYAANGYFGWLDDGSAAAPVKIADVSKASQEATATGCGLTNGEFADDSAPHLADEVTRARVYLSVPLSPDEDAAQMIEAGDCRYNLSGVWSDDMVLANDSEPPMTQEEFATASKNSGQTAKATNAETASTTTADGRFTGLSGANPEPLTNASFVNPQHISIVASADGNSLTINNAVEKDAEIKAASSDGVPLADAMVPLGKRKTYTFTANGETSQVFLDVMQSGRVRLQIDGVNFFRPGAEAMQAATERSDDAWMIDRNLDNLGASLRGYNIVEQDPMKLNVNNKGEIFARAAATEYSVVEKRTVPLGLKLVPHGEGGSVTGTRMIRSSREFQQTVGMNMGRNVGVGLGEAAGISAGAQFAYDRTSGMRSETESSFSWGYARHKEYSLVQDQPFSRLSDEFVDAIYAAHRFGEYDALVEKFGTHFPYAVTYGSGLVMWNEFSSQTLANWQEQGFSLDTQAAVAMKGLEVEATQGIENRTKEQTEAVNAREDGKIENVGGNGSFSAEGFSSAKPYPIMADLRPLHLLLNPLNFPDSPEIYTEARAKLQQAIDRYLAANNLPLADDVPALPTSNLPGQKRIVTVSAGDIWCASYGSKFGKEWKLEILGYIDFEVLAADGTVLKTEKIGNWDWKSRIKLNCKDERGGRTSYAQGKQITFEATDKQLNGASFAMRGKLQEGNWEGKRDTIAEGRFAKWGISAGTVSAHKIDEKASKNHVFIDAKIEAIR